MKTCISSYSFSQLLRSGKETQLGLVRRVKDMGFDAIEFTDLTPPEGTSRVDYAQMLRAESEKCSLPIANYTVGADFLNCADFDAEVERLKGQLDIAKILGVRGMRHDATGGFRGEEKAYWGFAQALPILIEGCERVTHYAKSLGIATMVENHGFFCQESQRVEQLVTGVADENFGILVDVGNFACADDPSPTAVGRLANYAKHVHVKDFHIKSGSGVNPGAGYFQSRGGEYLRGAVLGHGNIPVVQCLSILGRSGYDGYVSIEFEGIEDAVRGIEISLENLERFLEMAAVGV